METKEAKPNRLKKIGDYKYDSSETGKLGKGNFGTVYKGRCISNKKSVAVKKIYLPDFPIDFEKHLIREIKITKIVDHPNSVKFYDVLKTDNNLYIISEYCNGGNLETFLKKSGPIVEEEALDYMKQLVRGYKSLHEKKIIHRDIKPSNLVFKDGIIKIADYGFAKIVESNEANTILGTPLYMAPDIMQGNQYYDNTCDIWAFGFVFFEMLYQKCPWTGITPYELYSNITKNALCFPDKPVVSDQTKNLLRDMLKIKDRIKWEEIFEHPYFKELDLINNKGECEGEEKKDLIIKN